MSEKINRKSFFARTAGAVYAAIIAKNQAEMPKFNEVPKVETKPDKFKFPDYNAYSGVFSITGSVVSPKSGGFSDRISL